MIFYTICLTNRQHGAKACAVIPAVSKDDALSQAREMEREGIFIFLPKPRNLTARRSSPPEVNALYEWLKDDGESLGNSLDPAWAVRKKRKAEIFHQKLWMGEIALKKPL